MSQRAVGSLCLPVVLVVLVGALLPVQPAAAGQDSRPATAVSDPRTLLRTAWGDPDLQGMWDNGTITPIERPSDLADTPFLTEEEVAAREQRAEQNRFADRAPRAGDVGTYNRFLVRRGNTGRPGWTDVADAGRQDPSFDAGGDHARGCSTCCRDGPHRRRGEAECSGAELRGTGQFRHRRTLYYRRSAVSSRPVQ